MRWFKSPFDPVDREDRLLYATISAVAGVVGLALAVYFIAFETSPRRFIAASIVGATGLFSLQIAKRLFTNRSPYKSGALVSPWLTLTVGVVLVLVGVGNLLLGAFAVAWAIPAGAAAIFFAWRQLYPDHDDSSTHHPDGA